MADPELQDDEQVLIRTPNVHVKSFSFEAILTNKRVILVDRLKNILPPKEIPLATIQSIEPWENEIREIIITLGVITKTGGTRQMVLTFSRRGGENRIKERDAWIHQIRARLTPSFEPVIRKVIPGDQSTPAGQNKVTPHISATVRSPVPPARPAGFSPPVKKIVKNPLEFWQAPALEPEKIFGTYCNRCGKKIPDGSNFCNMCGTRIIHLGKTPQVLVSAPDLSIPVSAVVPSVAPPAKKRFIFRLFSPKGLPPTPLVPSSMAATVPPSPKKPANKQKIILVAGVIVIILIAVFAVAGILPKVGVMGSHNSSGSAVTTTTTAAAVTTKSTGITNITIVKSPRQRLPFPTHE